MGNNIAICSNDYNGILLFAYLGEYIYQRYYYMVSFSGLIYCMNAVSSEADETYIKKSLKII